MDGVTQDPERTARQDAGAWNLDCGAFITAFVILGLSAASVEAQQAAPNTEADGVSYQDLLSAKDQPENWLTYSGQYNGQRFSRLKQLHDGNVSKLRVKWVRQYPTLVAIETTPLVVNGIMYATIPPNQVVALDANTGLEYWSQQLELAEKLVVCCGNVNRGLAVLGDKVYWGTLDARLVARDIKNGAIVWQAKVIDHTKGYAITSAPLVVKDMVITGIAGGEYGIRGFVAAYDAQTGEERWRRHTTPEPGEPHSESWAGDSWKRGGAATWVTGSFDPQLNTLYWGVGNPGPDFNGEVRKGDNLYSDCVLALDPDTGKIKWHFQFTPHDVWDWDTCQSIVLADAKFRGKMRKLLLLANRNAFFYVLDRETGEFLLGKPFAKQTWADGLDAKGRPRVRPDKIPTRKGVLIYPDVSGAANWWSPTYSPNTGLFYQLAFDGAAIYFTDDVEYKPGRPYMGGAPDRGNEFLKFPAPSFRSAVRAIQPQTGKIVWEYDVPTKSTSGLLSTAGNLVFGGTAKGNFFALDAQTGEELWRLDLGARVHAAPVTYTANGKQYVTIAAGSALFTFGL